MKLNVVAWLKEDAGETLATFGNARLVKRLAGKIALVGGSAENRATAKEWVALFLARSGRRMIVPGRVSPIATLKSSRDCLSQLIPDLNPRRMLAAVGKSCS